MAAIVSSPFYFSTLLMLMMDWIWTWELESLRYWVGLLAYGPEVMPAQGHLGSEPDLTDS